MSLRQLAAKVGLQPASLYNHVRTKQDLLFDLIHEHMLALLRSSSEALAAANGGAIHQLREFIAHHMTYHMEKKREVFVANFELRSLETENYRKIVALRREYEGGLVTILERCAADGLLDISDPHITAYAILAMLTGACTWYRPDGRLPKADVIEQHTKLVLFGCSGSQGRSAQVDRSQPPGSKLAASVQTPAGNPAHAEVANLLKWRSSPR
jgi:AcrR family transcriptional regulator